MSDLKDAAADVRPTRPSRVRVPAVAGGFYPRDARSLRASLEECFSGKRGPGRLPVPAPGSTGPRRTLAGIVPHAGYIYSGPIAAHLFSRLAKEPVPSTVLLLGVNHHGRGSLFSVSDEEWSTPLGVVPTDRDLAGAIGRGPVDLDADAHLREHSIEVELPFLQTVYPTGGFRMIALQVTFTHFDLLAELGAHLRKVVGDRDVLWLASTDFSHYVSPEVCRRQDDRALEPILRMDPGALYERVVQEDISMCGIAPTTALLCALQGSHAKAELLAKGHSGDAEPMDQVVGYASIAISRSG
ncbi:MAG: AmmeMemoRadiSam system protein B [Euryarchaeota archaeon]|nr:AmmeMemoRadiSam system protein B [Euryarchaeota archaeon]MDE1881701.1 AmmeMemoRadiSam system protein B [Euryarchaeota archaeon]